MNKHLPKFIFCAFLLSFTLLSCRVLTSNSYNSKDVIPVELIYFEVFKEELDYTLHGSVLLRKDRPVKGVAEVGSIDSFLCNLYSKGIKFYDGSSTNYLAYDSLSRMKVQSNEYIVKLANMYESLTTKRISFAVDEGYINLRSLSTSIEAVANSFRTTCNEEWFDYEYEVPCSCFSVDSTYLITNIYMD